MVLSLALKERKLSNTIRKAKKNLNFKKKEAFIENFLIKIQTPLWR
jgi:hypothetical protein